MLPGFNDVIDLLRMLVVDGRTGVLIALLVVAACIDIKRNRIPNWLVFGGAVYGLLYNTLFPVYPREVGILFALGGWGVGLAMLLPMYMLRVMGAGDVKLMAMAGAFLGASATFNAGIATFIAGGVLAIAVGLSAGTVVRMVRNVAMMFRGTMLTFATGVGGLTVHGGPSAGKMPYGVAIATGTIGYLILAQLGLI
jgi:prepilin peptidase CpaA